jgi:hypothetical protein
MLGWKWGVLGDREGPKKAPGVHGVDMRERRGGAAEFRIVPMHACDLHAVVGRKIMCAGARWGWLRAGGVAEGRPERAPRPRVRSGNKIILYASALRGPSRARPRRALHTAYAARGLSRDPAAFISFSRPGARGVAGDRRGVVVTFYE